MNRIPAFVIGLSVLFLPVIGLIAFEEFLTPKSHCQPQQSIEQELVYSPLNVEIRDHEDRVFLHTDAKAEWYEMKDDELGRTPLLNKAWHALQIGNNAWKKGSVDNAIQQWGKTAKLYRHTDAALAALSNIGQAMRATGNYPAAINAYKTLVTMPLPVFHQNGMLGPFTNYKHKACMGLSDMFLESHDYRPALTYAELALNTHQFSATCGLGLHGIQGGIRSRIASIEYALAQKTKLKLQYQKPVIMSSDLTIESTSN